MFHQIKFNHTAKRWLFLPLKLSKYIRQSEFRSFRLSSLLSSFMIRAALTRCPRQPTAHTSLINMSNYPCDINLMHNASTLPCASELGEVMDTECERWTLFSLFVGLGLLFKFRWHYSLPLYSICVTRVYMLEIPWQFRVKLFKAVSQSRSECILRVWCDAMRCEYGMRFVEPHTIFLVAVEYCAGTEKREDE